MSPQHPDRPAPPHVTAKPHGPATPREQPRRRQVPLYRVILHYQAANDLMFIVRTVMELTRLCRTEATHKMWQAYHAGCSLLLTTYRERAELYVEQFASRGLTVSIEPAG